MEETKTRKVLKKIDMIKICPQCGGQRITSNMTRNAVYIASGDYRKHENIYFYCEDCHWQSGKLKLYKEVEEEYKVYHVEMNEKEYNLWIGMKNVLTFH